MLLQKRIFEWSKGLPLWQRDLLRRLTAGPLDEDGRRELLDMLTQSADAHAPVPLELDDLPADEGEHGCVELRAIRDLNNINCLAPAQSLSFEPGLNVVFGDNGSGKSGYGRLLRRVTRSGEPEEVLRDVFDPGAADGPQTAQLEIAVDGVDSTVTIDLAADPDRRLSAMGAFDGSRARLFLAKPNVIEHVPRPLRLLRALSLAQDELAESLRESVQQHRAALPVLPVIDPETVAGAALTVISATTGIGELISNMTLTEEEKQKLQELESTAAAILADQGKQLEAAARAQAEHARSAVKALCEADARLPESTAREMGELRKRLDDLSTAERSLAESAFAEQRFPGTGEGAWREMWLAAERFAQASGRQFPAEGDGDEACPLCQQDLDLAARERVRRFQAFVSSDLRLQAIDLDDQLKARLNGLPNLGLVRGAIEAELRGAPQAVSATAKESLALLDSRATTACKVAAGEPNQPSDSKLTLDPIRAYADTQEALAQRHLSLRDEEAQRQVMSQLAQLRARAALVQAQETLAEHVAGLQSIARINRTAAQLNTQRITMKLRELQEAAITERVSKAILEEVRALDPVASAIEIIGKASKGEIAIQIKLREPSRAKVGSVLSDGEQRALSLAFFLAEMAISEERSTIVFDDPVSSLDHQRRAHLATRLAEESKRRQVVIFTHDMAFVVLLQEAARSADVHLHGQTLRRAFHQVGMVADELPLKMSETRKHLRALRHRLRSELVPKHKLQNPNYEQEADAWVLDLRKAYDQLIEDTVLGGTVRRFSSHVQVRKLHEVKWTAQIAQRIDSAIHKASPKAHHEPVILHPAALTPEQLAAMLQEISALYQEMGGKVDETETPPAATEPVIRTVQL